MSEVLECVMGDEVESLVLTYRSGYKYQVHDDYRIRTPFKGLSVSTRFYSLSPNGVLTVRAQYAWDGPSGPAVDTRDTMIYSLLHDCLRQMLNEGALPARYCEAVDTYCRVVARRARMWKLRRWYFHVAVRINAKLKLVGPEKLKVLALKDGPEVAYWNRELERIAYELEEGKWKAGV